MVESSLSGSERGPGVGNCPGLLDSWILVASEKWHSVVELALRSEP